MKVFLAIPSEKYGEEAASGSEKRPTLNDTLSTNKNTINNDNDNTNNNNDDDNDSERLKKETYLE